MLEKYMDDFFKILDKDCAEYDELEKKKLSDAEKEKQEDLIAEKYKNLYIENKRKYNIIFEYDLKDAWNMIVSRVFVTSESKDNVWCSYFEGNYYDDNGKEIVKYYSVDASKIKKIILKYIDSINDDLSNEPGMLDGLINYIYMDVDGKQNELDINNLAYWKEGTNKNIDNILDMLEELASELSKVSEDVLKAFKIED